jgi:hypothetical protein
MSKDVQDKPEDAIETIPTAGNDDEDEKIRGPLGPEEFRAVLEKIDSLGLTWTADVPPLLRPRDLKFEKESFPAKEIIEIQNEYPDFPEELGHVIFYALTGSEVMRSTLGSSEDTESKVNIARELVIDRRPDFSSEFFFKYAIKVPYFVDLDWEVVVKAFERNVRDMPRIPYALLSLAFRQSMSPRLFGADIESGRRRTLTVAVDSNLIDKLIASLTEAKDALMKAGRLTMHLNEKDGSGEEVK